MKMMKIRMMKLIPSDMDQTLQLLIVHIHLTIQVQSFSGEKGAVNFGFISNSYSLRIIGCIDEISRFLY